MAGVTFVQSVKDVHQTLQIAFIDFFSSSSLLICNVFSLSLSSFLGPSGSFGIFSNARVKRRPSAHFELDLNDGTSFHSWMCLTVKSFSIVINETE